jgi:hypothetical protein
VASQLENGPLAFVLEWLPIGVEQRIDRDDQDTDVGRSLSARGGLGTVVTPFDDIDLTSCRYGDDTVALHFAANLLQSL